jgi:hypothetical protein
MDLSFGLKVKNTILPLQGQGKTRSAVFWNFRCHPRTYRDTWLCRDILAKTGALEDWGPGEN